MTRTSFEKKKREANPADVCFSSVQGKRPTTVDEDGGSRRETGSLTAWISRSAIP